MSTLTPDAVLRTAQKFVEEQLIPRIPRMEAGELPVLWDCWQQLAHTGLTGIVFPESENALPLGGLGLDSVTYLQVLTLIAQYSASFATTLSVHVSVGTQPLYRFGTIDQKQRFLQDLVTGKKLAAFGLTEPDAGSDAGNGQCRAELTNEGYRLNGSKIFITNAKLAEFFMVTARTKPEIEGPKGLSAFIIPKNHPGFRNGLVRIRLG
jgi:alkylation response protein AidB-like acyl-CoA dehydrogenase